MWVFLTTFLNYALGHVFRAVVIKFVLFSAIVIVVAGLALLALEYLIDVNFVGLGNLINGLPPGLMYFLVVLQFHLGVPLLIGALITRFAIRRLPVIG